MASSVAVVGAGLVGAGWAIVFARAGHQVRVFDADARVLASVLERVATSIHDLQRHGLVDDAEAICSRISVTESLAQALAGVAYVQESVLERVAVKRHLYEAIDKLVQSDVPVGSSSSGIPASAFTEGLVNAANYLIAHPVNPPYLHPLVELVPAPWTDPAAVEATYALMEQCGQIPIHIHGEVEGFVLNRLQGALLREAWALFEEGYASTEDIDKTVKYGLGMRWSFMGPFETIDLNAPGGVADYAQRLGPLYHSIAKDRVDPLPWSEDLIRRVEAERRSALPLDGLTNRSIWRDEQLMLLSAHRAHTDDRGD